MKILLIQWGSFGQEDLKNAFIQEGHSLVIAPIALATKTYKELSQVESRMTELLNKEKPDIIFTVSYFPAISDFCNKKRIRYVSWIYDSPLGAIYSKTITNSCNLIYTFDREICQEFRDAGVSTMHYLPMAANIERLDSMIEDQTFAYDVSFVGSLYLESEGNSFPEKSDLLTDYTKGYVDALVAAQLKIQGYNFIQEVLGPVTNELCNIYPKKPVPKDLRSDEYYCAENIINPWITAIERIDLLEAVAKNYGLDFFTRSIYKDFTLPNLYNHGWVDYNKEMPRVFKQSKINLNISRRGMKSAVPLRCFDIMGSGGFLLSNFQSGFLDLFVPEEDFVYYEDKDDLLRKIGYYLTHEEERKMIAKNGHDKIAAAHTYRHRVRELLDF